MGYARRADVIFAAGLTPWLTPAPRRARPPPARGLLITETSGYGQRPLLALSGRHHRR